MTFTVNPDVIKNNNFNVREDSGNLIIEHVSTGATFEYDSTSNVWVPSDDIDLQGTQSITNASSVSTEQATINQLAGKLKSGSGSQQSISTGSVTKVTWNSQVYEDSDVVSVDAANDEITVDVAGDYKVDARVYWDVDGNWTEGDIISEHVYTNGSEEDANRRPLGHGGSSTFTRDISSYLEGLSANDTIDIRIEQQSGNSIATRNDTGGSFWKFEVYKVG